MSEFALQRVAERFPEAIVQGYSYLGDETLVVKREHLVEVARFCKEDPELELKLPLSVTAVDYIDEKPRFELVYTLYSITKKHRLRIKVRVSEEDCSAPSTIEVWRGMDFWERYCWDMYGIRFTGRGPMKRLWMYEEFEGHPLRKDYPIRGRQPLIPEAQFEQPAPRGPGPGPGSPPASRSNSPRPSQLPVVK